MDMNVIRIIAVIVYYLRNQAYVGKLGVLFLREHTLNRRRPDFLPNR